MRHAAGLLPMVVGAVMAAGAVAALLASVGHLWERGPRKDAESLEGAVSTAVITSDDALQKIRQGLLEYRVAVLVESGHPVQDFATLRSTGPCGHSWDELQAHAVFGDPETCPWCRVTDQLQVAEQERDHLAHLLRDLGPEDWGLRA